MSTSTLNNSNFVQKLKQELLYHLDIFGQSPTFTILNRNKYPSALGFVTSILIGAFGLYFFLAEVFSMISKSKPSVYQTELSISETKPFLLQNDNFTLAISVVNRFSEPLIGIDRYFQLNVSQCERLRRKDQISGIISVTLNCTQLPIEPCNMSHFTTEIQRNYFSIMRMGGIQCINREYLSKEPLILQGQVTSMEYRYIFIQFIACQNTSQYQSCVSQEEIESVLSSGYYNIYKSDYLTTLDNPEQPYQEIITNEFTSFSLSTSKTISQLYSIKQTTTDKGLIWEQNEQQSNIQQSEWREISEFYNNEYLIVHYIRLDYKQTNNIRTYVKLQTILGKLGGIFQIFIMIVAIILRPLVENFMKLEMVNSIFKFSDPLQTQQNSHLIMSQIEKDIKIQINRTNNKIENQDPRKIQQNNKLIQSNFQTWSIIFGCNKFKKNQFTIAKNKINKNLELVNILKKLQEIKIIKKILLTNDQYILLKKYRRQIDKNGFLKIQNCHQIKQNILFSSGNQDQINQKNDLENFNLEQRSQLVFDQLYNKTPENLIQRDIFNSCCKLQEINSLNYAEIQEPISQTPKQ